MIITESISVFDAATSGLIHACNCMHTMGAGLAKAVAERYPEALAADKKTLLGCSMKLGNFSVAETTGGFYVYNLYSQLYYGTRIRYTNYDAVCDGLTMIRNHAESHSLKSLAIPFGLGCGLGGGSWPVVNAIINEVFGSSKVLTVMICDNTKVK